MTDETRYHLSHHHDFEIIASLWRERENREFVSRKELHDEMTRPYEAEFADQDEMMSCLTHKGVDSLLDHFAVVGPNEKAFVDRVESDWPEEPKEYWRYVVERDGAEGYVALHNLSPEELLTISERLKAEGDAALREAEQMQLGTEFLEPYFEAGKQKTGRDITTGEAEELAAEAIKTDPEARSRYAMYQVRGMLWQIKEAS